MDTLCRCAVIIGAGSGRSIVLLQNKVESTTLLTLSDVGIAIASSFAQQGCKCFCLGDTTTSTRTLDEARKAIALISPDAEVQCKTFTPSNESEVAEFFTYGTQKFGKPIEGIVNVASHVYFADDKATMEDFDKGFQVNQKSVGHIA